MTNREAIKCPPPPPTRDEVELLAAGIAMNEIARALKPLKHDVRIRVLRAMYGLIARKEDADV